MQYPNLKGKRYVGLVRCSTIGQAETSIEDQLAILSKFAAEHQMRFMGTVELDGVSGSIPGNRTDIEQLIERKRARNDFDVLLVQDTTRLTRAGSMHGAKIEYDLATAGIEVIFVTDNLPEGEYAEFFKTMLYQAGKQHAKSISLNVTRGQMSAMEQGRNTHCNTPPYGIDKMYLAPDGTPNHIIRALPDGTQVQLDPNTREVIGRFGRDETGKIPRHYRKQKNEKVVLVPGAEECVAVVRRMFAWHYIEGWGYRRITMQLNTERVPSSRGDAWTPDAVRIMLLNPIYRGLGIANRKTSSIYHMRAPQAPQRVETKIGQLALAKTVPCRYRPRADWYEREEPLLADYLEPKVRELARRKQEAHLEAQANGRRRKYSRDRHVQSHFILKGILTSKQGGHPMSGRRTGAKGTPTRYYAVAHAINRPGPDSVLRRRVPAEPLEKAALDLLRMVLQEPEIRPHVLEAVKCCRRTIPGQASDLARLEKRRAAIIRKIEFAVDQVEVLARDVLQQKITLLQADLLSVEEQIRAAQAESPLKNVKPQDAAKRIEEQLKKLGESLESMQIPALRRLLEALIEKAVVDLETRELELSLRVPSWAVENLGAMCLDTDPLQLTKIEAHPECGIILARVRFEWAGRGRGYHEPRPAA